MALVFVFPATKRKIRELYIQRFSPCELAIMYDLPEERIKGIVKGLKNQRHEEI